MKKNTLQKALDTAMVGAMAMGTLTACGGDAATTGSSAAGSSTESTSTSKHFHNKLRSSSFQHNW